MIISIWYYDTESDGDDEEFMNYLYRIKETWDLWEAFRTDCRAFSHWLSEMEVEVGDSEASMPTTVTKEHIRKYEVIYYVFGGGVCPQIF